MVKAINIGLSGLTAASTRLEVSANNIANHGTGNAKAFADGVDGLTSRQAYSPKQVRNLPLNNGGVDAQIVNSPSGSEVSLPQEIVNMKIAEQTYKANAMVIKTALEVEETLLDTFSKQKD